MAGTVKRAGLDGQPAMVTLGIEHKLVIYDDTTTYEYYCYASPGTALSTAGWKIMRLTKADSTLEWANVVGNKAYYNNVATDLSAVAALSYS